jgi:hypothetical protein
MSPACGLGTATRARVEFRHDMPADVARKGEEEPRTLGRRRATCSGVIHREMTPCRGRCKAYNRRHAAFLYKDEQLLLEELESKVIDPAEAKAREQIGR